MFSSNSNDWQVSLHFNDSQLKRCTIDWRGNEVSAVSIDAEQLRMPFPSKFDSFIQSINSMEGGYAEGDGSYGVVGQGGEWKICGNIYENLDAIQYVELLGQCPNDQLASFIELLGCDISQCIIQNLQGGFFQTFDQFTESRR